MYKQILMTLAVVGLLMASPIRTHATTIDFEGLADLEAVAAQFSGLTFTNTTAFTSGAVGGSLNEFDFPPRSGITVVSDAGGPIVIEFDVPQGTVSGFFTYAMPLTLTAFDALNNIVGTDTSDFSENFVSSGNPENELLSVTSLTNNISHVTITGDPFGDSFILDDLTFTQITTSIPEPSTLILLVSGFAGILGWRSVRCFRNGHCV